MAFAMAPPLFVIGTNFHAFLFHPKKIVFDKARKSTKLKFGQNQAQKW